MLGIAVLQFVAWVDALGRNSLLLFTALACLPEAEHTGILFLSLSLNNETDKASLITLVRESADRLHSFKVPSITVIEIEIKIVSKQTNLCIPT